MKALLLAATLFVLSSATSAAIGATPPARADIETQLARSDAEKLIRSSLHAWETGDVALFRSTVTSDLVFAYPGAKTDLAGALAMFDRWRTKYENTRVYIHRILIDGARYAVEYQFATTRIEGGKRSVVGTVTTGTIRDGRLSLIKEYLDGRVSRMQEAGDLPLSPEGTEPYPWPLTASTAASAASPPQFPPPPAEIPGARRVIYKTAGSYSLPMYIFGAPEARPPRRPRGAVLFFHGSGWQSGTVLQFVDLARHLASKGLVTAVVEYRVQVTYGASPFDSVADAKSALRWIRAHATSLAIDPHKVAAIGASSGGHIALAAALFANNFDDPDDDKTLSARPDALILFAPVVDTTEAGYPAGVPLFAGRERELSPLHHISDRLPPTLIFQGTADQSVHPSSVEEFASRCEQLHLRCTLRLFPGRDHHFYNSPDYFALRPHLPRPFAATDYGAIVAEVDNFLREYKIR
jgi:acetyl esterase/lipase